MAYVYEHIRLDTNEIFYVGIGKTKDFGRAYSKHNRSSFWKNVVAKTEYSINIIARDLTWCQAEEVEIQFVKKYGRRNLGLGPLVNLTDGGGGLKNCIVSEETRKKQSESGKLRKPTLLSKDARKRISETLKSKNMSVSNEKRKKISEANKDKQWSKERRLKLSNNKLGKEGHKHSEESKLKMKGRKAGKQIVLHLETGIFYDSIKEAARCFQLGKSLLSYKLLNNIECGFIKI